MQGRLSRPNRQVCDRLHGGPLAAFAAIACGSSWPLTAAAACDCRGSFRGHSRRASRKIARPFLTQGGLSQPFRSVLCSVCPTCYARWPCMRRRQFIGLVGGFAATWPLAARAQAPLRRLQRIGVLMSFADPTTQSYATDFRARSPELGWIEGSNLRTEVRWGAGDPIKFSICYQKDGFDLRPDVIVGESTCHWCRSSSRDKDEFPSYS